MAKKYVYGIPDFEKHKYCYIEYCGKHNDKDKCPYYQKEDYDKCSEYAYFTYLFKTIPYEEWDMVFALFADPPAKEDSVAATKYARKSFADCLKKIMKEDGFTKFDLAVIISQREEVIDRLLNGKSNLMIDVIARYAVIFGYYPKITFEKYKNTDSRREYLRQFIKTRKEITQNGETSKR